ncbi:hypothetical protein FHY30_000775 [Xanthomonas arboricola]|nr:hypothetical protein [Xanthomonas campestris]
MQDPLVATRGSIATDGGVNPLMQALGHYQNTALQRT